MVRINLFTTYYPEKNTERRKELNTCILRNLENPEISSVTVFNEGGDLQEFKSHKLKIVDIQKRPVYQDFLSYINKNTKDDDVSIISNTDIYFDKDIGVLKYLKLEEVCLALSRWDTTESHKPQLFNKNSSQDVWLFKGKIKPALSADFPLGVPRCDNRFLYELQEAGYKVLNPAYSIKAFHLHKGQRDLVYSEDDNKHQIPPPYRYLYPHNMFGLWKTIWFNVKHAPKLERYCYDIKKLNNWWVVRLPRKLIELVIKKKMPLIGYDQ